MMSGYGLGMVALTLFLSVSFLNKEQIDDLVRQLTIRIVLALIVGLALGMLQGGHWFRTINKKQQRFNISSLQSLERASVDSGYKRYFVAVCFLMVAFLLFHLIRTGSLEGMTGNVAALLLPLGSFFIAFFGALRIWLAFIERRME